MSWRSLPLVSRASSGSQLLPQMSLMTFQPLPRGRRVAVISNETVAPLYLETLLKALQGHEVTPVVLPDGDDELRDALAGDPSAAPR